MSSRNTGEEPADVESPEPDPPAAPQRQNPEDEGVVRTVREEEPDEPPRTLLTLSGTRWPYVPYFRLRARHVIAAVASVVVAIATAVAVNHSEPRTAAEAAAIPAPATTVTTTVTATATATATVTASPAEPTDTQASEPTEKSSPVRAETTPQPTFSDSPGRHDGSNYDNLSPEGQQAHDTLNCADVPGHKKGSCNEPNRKCNLDGAQVISSGGIRLTCQMADDARLRWLP
ncbi:hypothetical protein ACWEPD_26785 [Streptomyces pseudogriseolus]